MDVVETESLEFKSRFRAVPDLRPLDISSPGFFPTLGKLEVRLGLKVVMKMRSRWGWR